jgi:hypothetical protein
MESLFDTLFRCVHYIGTDGVRYISLHHARIACAIVGALGLLIGIVVGFVALRWHHAARFQAMRRSVIDYADRYEALERSITENRGNNAR